MTYRTSLLALMLAVGLAAPATVLAHDTAKPAAAHEMTHDMVHEVVLGDLAVSGGFARATLPNAPVGGGFLTIICPRRKRLLQPDFRFVSKNALFREREAGRRVRAVVSFSDTVARCPAPG